MAGDTHVALNNGSGGAEAAVYQDSVGDVHQKVILEVQAGGTDPVKLTADGTGNLNVNLAAGGIASDQDGTAFAAGTTTGLPLMGAAGGGAAVGSGNLGVLGMTLARALFVALQAAPSGGWTPFKLVSAGSTNATSVKVTAGQVGAIYATNNGAGWAYVKLYNKASAPTVGTDTPVYIIGLPPGGGGSHPVPAGLQFTTGIALAITGGLADNDTTAVALNQVGLSLGYA